MIIVEYFLDILAVISAGIAITQAISARNDRKQIESYKIGLLNKIKNQTINRLYEDGVKVRDIIIRNRTKDSIQKGRNIEIEKEIILNFISEVVENKSLFPDNVADIFFNDMNKSISSLQFNNMYVSISGIMEIIKKEHEKYFL